MHRLKGVVTMPQARQELARVERHRTPGRDPFAVMRAPEVVGPVLERFKKALTNRNAQDTSRGASWDLREQLGRAMGEASGGSTVLTLTAESEGRSGIPLSPAYV